MRSIGLIIVSCLVLSPAAGADDSCTDTWITACYSSGQITEYLLTDPSDSTHNPCGATYQEWFDALPDVLGAIRANSTFDLCNDEPVDKIHISIHHPTATYDEDPDYSSWKDVPCSATEDTWWTYECYPTYERIWIDLNAATNECDLDDEGLIDQLPDLFEEIESNNDCASVYDSHPRGAIWVQMIR